MIPRLMDRLNRLEVVAAPPSTGKHLVFKVEAPSGTPISEIVAVLRDHGHAIHDDDDVFAMNLGGHCHGSREEIRDLSPDVLTEEVRATAPPAGTWPSGMASFTFHLESPGGRQ